MGKQTTKVFTRAEIYSIRDRALHESAAEIRRTSYPHVSLETIRRIIRRDTYAEIGVGGGERPFMSNRLKGEQRQAGDFAPTYHRPVKQETPEEIAASEERMRVLEQLGVAMGVLDPTPKEDPIEAFLRMRREGVVEVPGEARKPPRDAYDIPEADDAPQEGAEAILARQAAAIPQAPADAATLLDEMARPSGVVGG